MLTIRSFSLNIYLIYTIEHIKVIHIYGTRISFHRREHICQRHSQHLHLVTVYIKIELRNLRLQRRRKSRQFLAFLSIIHQSIRCLYQIFKSSFPTCLKLHFKATGCSQSRDYRRSRKIDSTFGVFPQILFHFLHYLIDSGIFAFLPGLQYNS